MRHSPAFLATSVVTLAVGLTLVTVAFTIFNAYLLRPLPIRDPAGLYQIGWRSPDAAGRALRWRDYQDLRERADLFEAVIGERSRSVSAAGQPLLATFVSDNYFAVLGPRMLIGRPFGAADDLGSERLPVVLSGAGRARLFGSDAAVLGREVEIEDRVFVVVGVLRDFTGMDDSPRDVWLPAGADAAVMDGDSEARAVEISARLAPGASASAAQDAITPAMALMTGRQDDVRAEVMVQAPSNPLSFRLLALLLPIVVALGLVLAAACANVSNVMLARAIGRHREIAVRLALGASRGRVVRQFLTEALLIATLAGLLALVLASWLLGGAVAAMYRTLPPSLTAGVRLLPLDIDHRVFLFTLGAATGATLLCALLPALQASSMPGSTALRGQGGDGRRGARLRGALVTAQVAVSLALLVVALTFTRNGAAIGHMDPGYQARGVVAVNVRATQDELVARLALAFTSDPRVAAVAVTSRNPLAGRSRVVEAAPEQGAAAPTAYSFVSPEYFAILRMPMVRGRAFSPTETSASSPVGLISAATAQAFWPNEDPIGKTIRIDRPASPQPPGRRVRTIAGALRSGSSLPDHLPGYAKVTVVGVVRDVVSGRLVDGAEPGHIYFPLAPESPRAAALLLRGHADRDLGTLALQHMIRQAGVNPLVLQVVTLEEMRAIQIYPLLALSWVGSLLGAVALTLSIAGLYGVLIYLLSQRTREIGIRMALGATAVAVMRLVVRQSLRLAGVGALAGVVAAGVIMKLLSAMIQLHAVALFDLSAFSGGLALVLAATVLAACAPARRAARVDPARILHADG